MLFGVLLINRVIRDNIKYKYLKRENNVIGDSNLAFKNIG